MKHVLTFLGLLGMVSVAAAGDIWVVGVGIASDIKLPSGRVLKHAQVGPVVFTTGLPTALVLKYQTNENIDSKEALSNEVTDIWTTFRLEAEKGKYPAAIIMVDGPADNPLLLVRHTTERCFVFELKEGVWKMGLPSVWHDQKEPPPSPTP